MNHIQRMWSRIKAALIGMTVLVLGAWQPACACSHDHQAAAPATHHHAPADGAHTGGEHGGSAHQTHAALAPQAGAAIVSDAAVSCATDGPASFCDHSGKTIATAQASSTDAVRPVIQTPIKYAVMAASTYPREAFQQMQAEPRSQRLRPPRLPSPVTLKVRLLN